MSEPQYAGFWIRVGAAIIDSILIMLIVTPLVTAIYGKGYWDANVLVSGKWDFLLSYIFPAAAIIVFWLYKSATPGKMLTQIIIVDANSGGKPTLGQFIIRYLGYFASTIPFCVGLIWIAFDKRKQGWHDKLARTVVIKENVSDQL